MNGPDAGESRRASIRLLITSICLNVALAIFTIRLLSKTVLPTPAPSADHPGTAERAQVTVMPPTVTTIAYVTNRFHWRQIESTNYEEYVANLRAIGCPEQTVRDIIVADVNKLYESRRRALGHSRPFWQAGRARKLADREEAKQSDALDEEKRMLLKRLLAIEIDISKDDVFGSGKLEEQALVQFLFGPMPDDKLRRVLSLIEQSGRDDDLVQKRTGGILTDEDESELREKKAAMERELTRLLTPSQLEEMRARLNSLELFMERNWMEVVELTPAEARQIALARAGSDPVLPPRMMGGQGDEAGQVREAIFTNQVAALLGEERFTEFVRAQDRDYLTLVTLMRDKGLPRETAGKVYDLQQFAAKEVRRLREDGALDEASRRQQLEEMQGELQKSVSGVLGARAYEDYLQQGGSWITNVTGL